MMPDTAQQGKPEEHKKEEIQLTKEELAAIVTKATEEVAEKVVEEVVEKVYEQPALVETAKPPEEIKKENEALEEELKKDDLVRKRIENWLGWLTRNLASVALVIILALGVVAAAIVGIKKLFHNPEALVNTVLSPGATNANILSDRGRSRTNHIHGPVYIITNQRMFDRLRNTN